MIEQRQTGMVPSGSTVEVVVSKGHAPVGFEGRRHERDRGLRRPRALGFTVRTEEAFSNGVERGFVIGASPVPARNRLCSTVTLKVSLGRTFPGAQHGLTRGAAETDLEYGLQVSVTDLPGQHRGDIEAPRRA